VFEVQVGFQVSPLRCRAQQAPHPSCCGRCSNMSGNVHAVLIRLRSKLSPTKPVMLPPGCAKLLTRPAATGSGPNATPTIGIARVASCATCADFVPSAIMMSTDSRRSSPPNQKPPFLRSDSRGAIFLQTVWKHWLRGAGYINRPSPVKAGWVVMFLIRSC
jgi:hypothetical protein